MTPLPVSVSSSMQTSMSALRDDDRVWATPSASTPLVAMNVSVQLDISWPAIKGSVQVGVILIESVILIQESNWFL